MPKRKRIQREHTEDWQTVQQYTLWPEQTAYELLRPIVLFGDPTGKRAQETGAAESTLDRKADSFAEQGMVSFFASKPRKQPQETARSLPPDMRQLIVDLRVELPTMSLREIAEICEVRFDRKPSHNSVKLVLASGPPPSITSRRYQTWDQIASPAERRLAAIRLHSEGWSVASIAEYFPRDAQRVVSQKSNWRESVLHYSHVCRKEKEHFLTPTRGKAELIGWGPRSAVFPAWARSHTWVGQRLGPRPMLLFMTLS